MGSGLKFWGFVYKIGNYLNFWIWGSGVGEPTYTGQLLVPVTIPCCSLPIVYVYIFLTSSSWFFGLPSLTSIHKSLGGALVLSDSASGLGQQEQITLSPWFLDSEARWTNYGPASANILQERTTNLEIMPQKSLSRPHCMSSRILFQKRSILYGGIWEIWLP